MKTVVWALGIIFLIGAIYGVFDGIAGAQATTAKVSLLERSYWLGGGVGGLGDGGLRVVEAVGGLVCLFVGLRFIGLAGRMS